MLLDFFAPGQRLVFQLGCVFFGKIVLVGLDIQRNGSSIKLLNKIGPKIDLEGTPKDDILKTLRVLFIYSNILLVLFKIKIENLGASIEEPSAQSFTVR